MMYVGRSRQHALLGIVVLVLIAVVGAQPHVARGQVIGGGSVVRGTVRDHVTGAGVAATVRIGDLVLHTASDGTIPATTIPFAMPTHGVDVVVDAPNYPTWRFNDVELAHTHPVELQVALGAPAAPSVPTLAAATVASLDRPPDFINIGRTFNSACVYPPTNVQRIDRVPFMVYVRNVLPYEWIPSWPAASLDAGAVAAAQFAWSTALIDGKWTKRGYAFDVVDSTCDQVYQDRTAAQNFVSTDAAVARMWGTMLLRDNKLLTTYFRNTDERCAQVGGPDCMGQYGSRDRANEGMSGVEILQHYYDPVAPMSRLPLQRAVVWERSPNVVVNPGTTRTLRLRLLNVGASTWGRANAELRVVNAANPGAAFQSPFRHSSWIDAQHPAQLGTASVARGGDHAFWITIAAPPTLAPGTYQFALRWQHRDGSVITTEQPLGWTITVAPPAQPRIWLPVTR